MRGTCWSAGAGDVGRFGFWIVWRHDGLLLSVVMNRFETYVKGLADKRAIGKSYVEETR